MKKIRVHNQEIRIFCDSCQGIGTWMSDDGEGQMTQRACAKCEGTGMTIVQVPVSIEPVISNFIPSPGMFFGPIDGKHFDIPRV